MTWLATQMRWIMLVSGALTCTMLYATLAPEAMLTSNFGTSLSGPLANIVVRNWGALIGLMGALLIDSLWVVIFAAYLVSTGRERERIAA